MTSVPVFGSAIEGLDYTPRPGAYVLFFDESGRVGVAQTPVGLYLPGGGQEAGESLQQTAIREVGEECGLLVEIGELLGEAHEFMRAPRSGHPFHKQCQFFLGRVTGRATQIEDDHELIWLDPLQAAQRLTEGSARWAVQCYLDSATGA